MLIFLYGTDTYRSHQRLEQIIEKFKKECDPSGCNVSVIDCNVAEAQEAVSQAFASPFLAKKRMAVLKHLLKSENEELQSVFLARLKKGALPNEISFVFFEEVGESQLKGSELFEILKKERFLEAFAPLRGAAFLRWIMEEVKKRGAALTRDAARTIAEHSDDAFAAVELINQSVAFVFNEGRVIESVDVEGFVEEKIDGKVFAFTDALANGDTKPALKLLAEELRGGAQAYYLFSMVHRQFRIIAQLRGAAISGITDEAHIAKHYGLHPFVVKKTMKLAQRYSQEQLRLIYDALYETDAKAKTGKGEMEVLLPLFVGKVGEMIGSVQ